MKDLLREDSATGILTIPQLPDIATRVEELEARVADIEAELRKKVEERVRR